MSEYRVLNSVESELKSGTLWELMSIHLMAPHKVDIYKKALEKHIVNLESPDNDSDKEKLNSGEIVHRLMNDTQQLDYLIGNPLYTLCFDILDLIWISVIILIIDWKILAILFLIIPLLFVVSRKTGLLQRRYTQPRQKIGRAHV